MNRTTSVVAPVLAATLGIAAFSVMDAVMKRGSIEAGVYTMLLLRNTFGTALMGAVWLATGAAKPATAAVRLHALRSAVVAGMAVLFFWGLVRIPMAEGIALSFFAPLIALYLAAVLLHERIQPQAIAASVLGLAGVVVIALGRLNDDGGGHPQASLGIAAIVASAMLYAFNLVLQRQQAQIASPPEIALFQNLFVALFLLPAAPWLFALPEIGRDSAVVYDAMLAAVLAGIALLLLSWAYARAEAQKLVPLEYTGFVWAAIMGWLWFDEALRWTTLAGVVLIVGATWAATRRDSR